MCFTNYCHFLINLTSWWFLCSAYFKPFVLFFFFICYINFYLCYLCHFYINLISWWFLCSAYFKPFVLFFFFICYINFYLCYLCHFYINLISWWFLCSAYVKPICPMFKVGWIIDNPPDWTSCRFTIIYLGLILDIMNCWCILSHFRKITIIDEV